MFAENCNNGAIMHQTDFGGLGHRWDAGFSDFDADSFARGARVPRERPERPAGGGGSGSTGSTGGGTGTSIYISGNPSVADSGEYNVQINFVGSWSADLRQAFVSAAEAISDFILGDVANVDSRRSSIDDLVITARLMSIDGAGGILGQAGPDAVRPGSYLPYKGTMEFDAADASVYQAAGLFDDIVLHEMLHTVGLRHDLVRPRA